LAIRELFNFQLSTLKPLMHFLVRKRRNTPTIIIVALLDVLIVLLISDGHDDVKQQSALKLALPESSQSQKEGATTIRRSSVSITSNAVVVLDKSPIPFDDLKGGFKKKLRESTTQGRHQRG